MWSGYFHADDLERAWHGGWEVRMPRSPNAGTRASQRWMVVESVEVARHFYNFVGENGCWLAAGVSAEHHLRAELVVPRGRPGGTLTPQADGSGRYPRR